MADITASDSAQIESNKQTANSVGSSYKELKLEIAATVLVITDSGNAIQRKIE